MIKERETVQEEVEKIMCPLKPTIIAVRPIVDESSYLYQNTGRTALPGSRKGTMGVPQDPSTKRFIEPLTVDEVKWFESDECPARFPKGSLNANVYGGKSYWSKFTVSLKANEVTNLDLNTVEGYLKWAYLKAQVDKIAPSWEERYDKITYTHALVDLGRDAEAKVMKIDKQKEAYKFLGALETSMAKMRGFLVLYYQVTNSKKVLPHSASREWLIGELGEIIEKNIDGFLQVKNDKYLEIKSFITQALENNVIFKEDKNKYKIPGMDDLYTLTELCEFLNDIENQKVYGKIKAQVESNLNTK